MIILMKNYMSGEPVLVNISQLIRATKMKEGDGSILAMTDGSRIAVAHSLAEIYQTISVLKWATDMTRKEGPV